MRRVDRGEDFSLFKPLVKVELPTALLQAWVAAMRGVGISRPENSTTPKRAHAQPPQLILRTPADGRNSGVDARAPSLVFKGSYTPSLKSQ